MIKLPIAASEGSGNFLKASVDFSMVPRRFRIAQDPEYVLAKDPKYGDEAGMVYQYHLEEKGIRYMLNSTSKRLAFAFNKAGVETGDTIAITKTGSGFDTSYIVTKVATTRQNPLLSEDELPEELMRP